jgi:class 3 adenylate cyclase/predicted ATPase
MFCDLVGSTALSARLDPEDLREIIAAYQKRVAEVVAGFGGFIARYMGDGVLVYFGYPQAHEDDAERAVRAGLGAIDAVGRLDVKSVKLEARVGIATGLVVVGDALGEGSAQEQSVVGETPNLAARLQILAEPNAVVIAASTRRLVGDLFEYCDLGGVEVKGIAAPVPAWEVLRPSGVESRFEALHGSTLTRLVGREEEIDLLLRRWARAKAGEGQVVLVSGEPGIGKSRITAALEEHLRVEPHLQLRYFCSPYHQDSALFPLIDQLGRAAGFARDDPPAAKLKKFEVLLARVAPPEEDVALLADLLLLPASERHPLPDLSPQRKKDKTLEALIRRLEDLACQQSVLMVFEDAHWIDPTSRELLDLIIERVRTLPVLVMVTFRAEFQPHWIGQPQVTMLALGRLDRRDRTTLAGHIAGGKALPAEVVEQIADRTDGVPLFVEELTKSVLESGLLREEADRYVLDRALAPFAIPTTLHDSLVARLDRLAPVRPVAQTGAAIGREFSYALLHAVSRLDENELQAALARLVASELVFQRGPPPDAVYSFKHALVQDAAHETLLRSKRRELHARIAAVLEERFPEVADQQPELLAHHYTEAGSIEQAVVYWGKAGRQSAARSAMIEAEAQLRRGLLLISDLPDSPERKQRELDLQVTLASALMESKGHVHPEVAEVLGRAQSLIVETAATGTVLHFSVLYGLWVAQYLGGEPIVALEQAKEFLALARSQGQSGLLLVGHRLLGTALVLTGDYRTALSHLNSAVELYRPEEHQELAFRFGADIGITAQCVRAWALWHRGYPDQARRALDEGLHRARRSIHRHTLAYALIYKGLTAASARWAAETEAAANELVSHTREHGFALFLGYGLLLQAGALTLRGQGEAAVDRIHEAMAAMQATGMKRSDPIILGYLAEALALKGAVVEGLQTLAAALRTAETSGAHWADAELHRLRGILLGQLPSADWTEVENCFRTALTVAREQGTRGFELRAADSLARLLCTQTRRDEARDLLALVYGWFTEGFDTPDLLEAKAVLQALDA